MTKEELTKVVDGTTKVVVERLRQGGSAAGLQIIVRSDEKGVGGFIGGAFPFTEEMFKNRHEVLYKMGKRFAEEPPKGFELAGIIWTSEAWVKKIDTKPVKDMLTQEEFESYMLGKLPPESLKKIEESLTSTIAAKIDDTKKTEALVIAAMSKSGEEDFRMFDIERESSGAIKNLIQDKEFLGFAAASGQAKADMFLLQEFYRGYYGL